jgi:nicotinate-nucleotide adenylyltransferase
MKGKIILLGGSFDPIHNGHIIIARHAIAHTGADKLVFIPAQRSPHKPQFPAAGAADRLKMVELAIADEKKMSASDCELKREPPSYTIDTVRHFQKEYGPEVNLYWLIGADMLKDLPRWYRIEELLDECSLSLMMRPGFDKIELMRFVAIFGQARVNKLERNIIDNPLIDISSTEIRRRIASGQDVSQMVHPAVLAYIKEKRLYIIDSGQ